MCVTTFLSTPIFEKLVVLGEREGILTLESGWSIIPGRIELKQVHLEVEDHNIHLFVDIPRAHAKVRLSKIFKKEANIIQLDGPVGEEGEIQVRLALRTDAEKKKYVAEKKQIEQAGNEGGSITHGTWTIHIEQVDLSQFKELIFDKWKYVGKAQVTGGFKLTPGKVAEIFQSRLNLEGGSVEGFAKEVTGAADVRIDRFMVPDVEGSEVYRYVHAQVDGRAKVEHIRFFNQALASTSYASLDDGAGNFRVFGKIESGYIQPGTHASINSEKISLKLKNYVVTGKGKADWNVTQTQKQPATGKLKLNLKNLKITKHRGLPLAHDGSLQASAATQDLDLVDPFNDFVAYLNLAKVKINHLTRWNALMPMGLSFEDGYGSFNLYANAHSGLKAKTKNTYAKPGELTLSLRSLKGLQGTTLFTVQSPLFLTADIDPVYLGKGEWSAKNVHLIGREIDFKFKKETKTQNLTPWHFHVYLDEAKFKERGKKYSLTGRARVWLKNSWPVLEWINQQEELSGFVYSAALKDSIRLITDFSMQPDEIAFQNIELELGKHLQAHGELYISGTKLRGALVAGQGFMTVGIKLQESKTSYSLFAGKDWLEYELEQLHQSNSTIPQ